jgi:hypothetical protein
MSPSDHEVIIDWTPQRGTIWWNEICAKVLEVFGLPGTRFIFTPTEDYMIFTFKSIKDAQLCRIMFSEVIS